MDSRHAGLDRQDGNEKRAGTGIGIIGESKTMDNHVDERDYRLLERDRYTFLVLRRIIGSECSLLLTDHERLIICFTGEPYPVWIWTPILRIKSMKKHI